MTVDKVNLTRWAVYELPDGNRHLAGHDFSLRLGRVSTPVTGYDPEHQFVTTASGNLYRLVGYAGSARDGQRVWETKLQTLNLTWDDVIDVSHEYEPTEEYLARFDAELRSERSYGPHG